MRTNKMWKFTRATLAVLGIGVLCLVTKVALAQASLENVSFSALPGDQFEINLQFDRTPPKPEVFVIDQPARLTLDFSDTRNNLKERRYPLNFKGADSIMVLEAQGRTRMVVNLTGSAPYRTEVKGNSLLVVVGKDGGTVSSTGVLSAPDSSQGKKFVAPGSRGRDIEKLDFRRGDNDAGMVVVDLANSNVSAKVSQNGSRLIAEFTNASIDTSQQVRLDVVDFGTPVHDVSMYLKDGKVVIQATVTGEYDYLAYQTDKQYVISVTPQAKTASGGTAKADNFKGDRIDMNFQSIDVRAALQILADFNDFSLVVGDSVTGNITLRLENVPWDQALNLVLRSKKLGKRIDGNVLYVAPADEIANAEVSELESSQKVEGLAPLVTEYIAINYALATDLVQLLQKSEKEGAGNSGILTSRGKATVDIRTNTIIVQDVEAVLEKVKALIAKLDIPVRQVLIQARIVNASTSFSQALGIRWGGSQLFPKAGDRFVISGKLNSAVEQSNNISTYNQAISSAVASGTPLNQALASNSLTGPTFPDALMVDLGVNAPSTIALAYAGSSSMLALELEALEASGNGEVIAQPKITTQDQQAANITSGVRIPYQSQAGGTAGGTTTQFVTAALSLQVTPQITPDGRIIMKLEIHQDSIVPGSGAVPAIATNSVTTSVLVNNGDTVVLGGVYREEVTTSVSKTPLLGDIPYVGALFKRKEDSKSKTELLIFITPSVINELMK